MRAALGPHGCAVMLREGLREPESHHVRLVARSALNGLPFEHTMGGSEVTGRLIAPRPD
jgi:hypothetical protein